MNNTRRTLITPLAALITAGCLLFTSSAKAQILYSQTFDNSTAARSLNAQFGTTSANELTSGWAVFSSATATDQSSSTLYAQASNSAGSVLGGGTTNGFFDFQHPLGGPYLAATTPSSLGSGIDPTMFSTLTLQWTQVDATAYNASTAPNEYLQLAVQVGGSWYVYAGSDGTGTSSPVTGGTTVGSASAVTNGLFYSNPAGSSTLLATTPTLMDLTYTTNASDWLTLNFTAGSTLALGAAPTSNLSGDITGFGFYGDGANTGLLRADSFTLSGVSAVPEPSSLALMACGFILLLGTLARRRLANNPL